MSQGVNNTAAEPLEPNSDLNGHADDASVHDSVVESIEEYDPLLPDDIDTVPETEDQGPAAQGSAVQARAGAPDSEDPDDVDFSDLTLCVRPQSPPVGNGPLTSFITPTLQSMMQTPELAGRYRPLYFTRPLIPAERGYWCMETDEWPLDAQDDFWRFMERLISQSELGWHVWIIREPRGGQNGLGLVKVFCWGEVVQHVYLVLYLASHRWTKKAGCTWVDGTDQIVIRIGEEPVVGP